MDEEGSESRSSKECLSSRETNYALVDRMRDLAKWQTVVFGAIGGVLVAGVQISDLGTEGWDGALAIGGIVLALAGVAVALVFTVMVLLPIELLLPSPEDESRSLAKKLVGRRPDLLHGHASIQALATAKSAASRTKFAAQATFDEEEDEDARKALARAERIHGRAEEATQHLLSYVLAVRVRRRMWTATAAMLVGGVAVAGGTAMFSLAAGDGGTEGEAAPKRASAVTVQLTEQGREQLSEDLNSHCDRPLLRAIALGGPASALEMVAVPSQNCRAARFVLTPEVGAVVNEQRLRAVRACEWADPRPPCVVYENTPRRTVDALRHP